MVKEKTTKLISETIAETERTDIREEEEMEEREEKIKKRRKATNEREDE